MDGVNLHLVNLRLAVPNRRGLSGYQVQPNILRGHQDLVCRLLKGTDHSWFNL